MEAVRMLALCTERKLVSMGAWAWRVTRQQRIVSADGAALGARR
jgi:hypothetical protein